MLTIVFDNWLEICFLSLVSSIQVARLVCMLIGYLARLSSSFASGVCLHLADGWCYHWQGISSMVIVWLQRSITIPNLLMVYYQEWGHVAAYYPCCTQPHQGLNSTFAYRVWHTQPCQVLDRTFCYQSLTVLNCIMFWIELLLLESCLTQKHQVLSKPFATGVV